MVKKALIASAVVAATSGVALANGGSFVPPPPHCVGAFYIGAGVSRDIAKFKVDEDKFFTETELNGLPTTVAAPFLLSSRHYDINSDGIDGELFVGYGMIFDDHYTLAAEIFGDISSNRGRYESLVNYPTIATFSRSASYKVNDTWGVSILPGFKLTDSTNLYARIGWVISRFKADRDFGFLPANTVPGFFPGVFGPAVPGGIGFAATGTPGLFPFSPNNSKTRSGIQLGIGMEAMVTQNVGIRGEWDWQRYGNFNHDHPGFVSVNLPNLTPGTVVTGPALATIPTIGVIALPVTPGQPVTINGLNVSTGTITHTRHVRNTIDKFTLSAIYHFYS